MLTKTIEPQGERLKLHQTGSIVALVGMPGGGKTTVGRLLARQLGWRFVDTDAEIERELGCSVRDFFEHKGEAAFREIEENTLGALLKTADAVVLATGGGLPLREVNRTALVENTTGVYLHCTPEELFRRLRHDTQRPLLQVADPLARLRELYGQRDKLYREAAQFVIETGRPSVNTLVNMVLMQLDLAGVVSTPVRAEPVEASACRGAGPSTSSG
jgi:shikimate kinase